MSGRSRWATAILLGALVAALAAAAMAFADWHENPAGIFHGPGGTNWGFVWDTWISWFLPVFPIAAGIALAFVWYLSRRG